MGIESYDENPYSSNLYDDDDGLWQPVQLKRNSIIIWFHSTTTTSTTTIAISPAHYL